MANHQEIIHKLRDVHLPEPASIFPLQPAWWVIIAIFFSLLIGLVYYFSYHRKKQHRLALKKLKNIEKSFEQGGESGVCMMEIGMLLKHYATVQFPQTKLAHLWGEDWLAFLLLTSCAEQFEGEQGQAIIHWPYQKEPARSDIPALIKAVRVWIKENPHRSYRSVQYCGVNDSRESS